jgi:hypothetical protein
MKQSSVARLIGKIDNDFNIDNSDWIPRIAAWCIDALSQMRCLPKEKKRRTLEVHNRIAVYPCDLDENDMKVYTTNGCEVEKLTSVSCNCSKGIKDFHNDKHHDFHHESHDGIFHDSHEHFYGERQIGIFNNTDRPRHEVRVGTIIGDGSACNRNYIVSGCNKIELNFDADEIIVETNETATYYDESYNCELPYIYENGLLLEALELYCIYKMLCRGYKHQVFTLTGPEPVNPYIQWTKLKESAAASVKADMRNGKYEGWNNFFYNSTFLPRR